MDTEINPPLHTGYVPSQPDPGHWASLTLVADSDAGPAPPPHDPAASTPVTLASIRALLATAPEFSAILAHLSVPEVVTTAIREMGLTDLETFLAALSDVTELLDALKDKGVEPSVRPFVRARFGLLL